MLLEQTWRYITEHQLIRRGDKILVGVSGGADSVCLLLLLWELSAQQGFSLQAVHVNHKLRGQESEDDQAFVEDFCREREIPLVCYSCQVEALAEKRQIGIEEAGREARAEVFRQCLEEDGAQRVALAHHKNDQAETVLFRLARGSSLTGLSGIRPLQGFVIHPLLFADKDMILQELSLRGVEYRTDSSNLTDHYTRNCIRHQVLPVLEEKANEQSVTHIAEVAEDIAEADAYLKEMAEPLCVSCIEEDEERLLIRKDLLQAPGILQRYVLMEGLSRLYMGRKNLGREQIRQLQDLLKGRTGRKFSLPGQILAEQGYEGLLLWKKKESKTEEIETAGEKESLQEIAVTGPGDYHLGRWTFRCELLAELPSEIPEKTYTKWLDYDKINTNLVFRTRKPGDFLVVTEDGGRKKLKSYLIDRKLPARERGSLPLLASGSRVFWVVGHRISKDCMITAETKHVMKITALEENYE